MPVNKVKKYLKNLDKETNQAGNAGESLKKVKGTSKEKAAANKLRNERGQMFGALLQGRRYDEKGKQITKQTPKKPAAKTPAKTTPKAPAKKPTKMTPQDAAMKKILEKKYGKIYG
jgi:predicted RNA-binding Zn ribbon-like protein